MLGPTPHTAYACIYDLLRTQPFSASRPNTALQKSLKKHSLWSKIMPIIAYRIIVISIFLIIIVIMMIIITIIVISIIIIITVIIIICST